MSDPGLTGLNHITLAVTDLPRALGFYRDLLGARLRARWSTGAYLEIGPLWLCLTLTDSVTAGSNYSHIAFSCAPRDFARLAARIRAQARIWQHNSSEGDSLYFLDPDGHRLELHDGTLDSRIAHYRSHPEKGVTLYD
jgi:catechol 2,3-dioxygenase-like lactoylglutathione lyase family enzyme